MNDHVTAQDDFLNQLADLKPMDTQVDLAEVFYVPGVISYWNPNQSRI